MFANPNFNLFLTLLMLLKKETYIFSHGKSTAIIRFFPVISIKF